SRRHRQMKQRFSAAAAVILLLANFAGAAELSYNRDIRPILSDNCFACHGPDKRARKADLRLDIREEALAERDGVRAIVPSRPDESDLIARVLSTDKEEQMPPPKSHKGRLKPEQIAKLKEWISAGANYEPHWAFTPPVRAAVPALSGDRSGNTVDA